VRVDCVLKQEAGGYLAAGRIGGDGEGLAYISASCAGAAGGRLARGRWGGIATDYRRTFAAPES
jgi:hypothetical protein